MKLWGGRFHKESDRQFEIFNASIHFDQLLAPWDIIGSIAHAKALGQCGLLQSDEVQSIVAGLKKISKQLDAGQLQLSIEDEDIHMNIERLLTQEIGPLAGKLHTGRSRNDQVALDLHLYLREQLLSLIDLLRRLASVLVDQASQHIETILPGYTHLQRAQPVSLAHHLLAYVAMLQRDIDRLKGSWPRINIMPLGAGALAGAGFAIDRETIRQQLGFDHLYENSMDAVSDRDFVVEFLSASAMIMMHLSRFSEELVLWSSQEFAFIEFDDAYSSGSSMMPQKKNPDAAELVRAKTGRVYGSLMSLLTILKALPLTYNKDLQEDKEGLFDTVNTVLACVSIFSPMIATLKINTGRMRSAAENGFSNATEVADYLVRKGMAFRKAHEIVGKLVANCIEKGINLRSLPLDIYQQASPLFEQDLYSALTLEAVVNARNVRGGTAFTEVRRQIEKVRKQMITTEQWCQSKGERIIKLNNL